MRVSAALVLAIGLSALVLGYRGSRTSEATKRRVTSTDKAHGRVAYTLPLELQVPNTSAFFVGGELTKFWLEIPAPAPRVVFLIRAGGQKCSAEPDVSPLVELRVDDAIVHTFAIDAAATERRVYASAPLELAAGVRRVVLLFSNDYYSGEDCDRNAWVDQLLVRAEESPVRAHPAN